MDIAKIIGYRSKYYFGDKQKIKFELVTSILEQLLPERVNIKQDVSLYTDDAGCPHLSTSLPFHLNVSFSYCRDRIWSVIALDYPIGIDVEDKVSFGSAYPLNRVFSRNEQQRFQQVTLCKSSAAAALWTCKEAVAKSMKTGFNTIEPLDLSIGKIEKSGDRFYVEIIADKKYVALVEKENEYWRSIAGPCLMPPCN